jgi:hypothetical protein
VKGNEMNKSAITLAGSVIAALALTACGSSGHAGPGSSSPAPVKSSPVPVKTPTPTPPPTSAPPPSSPPPSRAIISFSGSGIKNSAPFTVSTSPVTVKYTWNCQSFGFAGNFIADMTDGAASSLTADDESIANTTGMSGSETTRVYPTDTGKQYHLEVNSECDWTLVVTG